MAGILTMTMGADEQRIRQLGDVIINETCRYQEHRQLQMVQPEDPIVKNYLCQKKRYTAGLQRQDQSA